VRGPGLWDGKGDHAFGRDVALTVRSAASVGFLAGQASRSWRDL
jgi:hypothetical protein